MRGTGGLVAGVSRRARAIHGGTDEDGATGATIPGGGERVVGDATDGALAIRVGRSAHAYERDA